jgi:exopolysaccharide production protein ExoQ
MLTIRRPLIVAITALFPVAALVNAMWVAVIMPLLCLLLVMEQPGGACSAHLKKAVMIALACMMLAIISTGWSLTPQVSAATAFRTCAMLAGGLATLWVMQSAVQLPAALGRAYAWGTACMVLVLLSQQLPTGGALDMAAKLLSSDPDRFLSKNINRGLCAAAVLLWPAALYLYANGKRLLAALLVILCVAGLLGMHSLSSKIGVLAGAVYFYATLYLPRRFANLLLKLLLVGFFAWPLVFYASEGEIRSHAYEHLPDSSKHRIEIWHFALERWQEKPLLGWGADTSRAMPGGENEVYPGWTYMPMHPHNAAMQLLLELGIAGYLTAVAALWFGIHALQRRYAGDRQIMAGLAAVVAAYLAVSFSAFNIWQAWWIAHGILIPVLLISLLKRSEIN